LAGGDQYSYRALVKAGAILVRMERREEANTCYKRVAEETPDSEEGNAARVALKRAAK